MYPVMPTTNIQDSQSDRAVLSRPSLVLVTWLLDSSLDGVTKTIGSRLAAALAACAQLSSLGKSSIFNLEKILSFITQELPRECGPCRPCGS